MPPAQLDPSKSVFINCPFDAEYEPLFRTLILACAASGFTPRSALESGSVATPRLDRILDSLFSSKYSIHDLSRCRGEGESSLARFNMPLELGMAMARHHLSPADHDWAVFVPAESPYQRYVSDLAGIDPLRHDGTPATVMRRAMSWLAMRPDAVAGTPSPNQVLQISDGFAERWRLLRADWGDDVPWKHVVQAAIETTEHIP